MSASDVAIGPISAGEVNTAIAVAARAFWDDPMFNYFAPNLLVEHKNLVHLFSAGIRDCVEHGEVWVARTNGTLVGVAAWLPPGVFPATSGVRALRQGLRIAPQYLRNRNRRTGFKMLNEMTARHPHDEHWYLMILATDPLHQRRGIGKALIEPTLARADEIGVTAYLETQTQANVAYYRGFGFEVIDEFSVDDSPPVWQMQRPAR